MLARLGRAIGYAWYLLHRPWRAIARTNLSLCFPGLSPVVQRRLLRAHFAAMGQALFSTLGITWYQSALRLRRWVTIKGREHFETALASPRGVILLAPHFVALELGFARLSLDYPLACMYRPPRRNLLHWAVDQPRGQFGAIKIASDQSLKTLVRLLREGAMFYYLPDLDEGKHVQHVFAPFFGVPAATITALPRLLRLTGAIALPCVTRQFAPGRGYEIRFLPPLDEFPSEDPVADAARVNVLIEQQVRSAPEQYFWIHRRFKTRPEREASLYQRRKRRTHGRKNKTEV